MNNLIPALQVTFAIWLTGASLYFTLAAIGVWHLNRVLKDSPFYFVPNWTSILKSSAQWPYTLPRLIRNILKGPPTDENRD